MINNAAYILFGLLIFFLVADLFYYLFFYAKLAFYPVVKEDRDLLSQDLPVSIVVCAQNEENNLREFLPKILEQDYPEFEVIVVNDGSTDETEYVMKDLVAKYPHLRVIELTEGVKNKQGKKFALMMGIKGAKYDHLLLTDADCEPGSKNWIRVMQSGFGDGRDIVLGYSPYKKKRSLLNMFIRYETFRTAVNYLSFAVGRVPYMGVGRNLAYNKKLFFENKGFSSHIHLMSGDDDLFINKVATSSNTAIRIHKDGFTFSEPKITWRDFFLQKLRHLGVGKYYKTLHKNLLSFHVVSVILFYLLFTTLLFFGPIYEWALIALAVKLSIEWIILGVIMSKLDSADLIIMSPFYEFFYHLYLLSIRITGLFYKQKTWK